MNPKNIDFVVLIPCYNNTGGLSASLKSISYPATRFEVLIVDDGSEIPVTIDKLQVPDPDMVINIIRLNHNQGIVQALNTGLMLLKSRVDIKYIARLDAGDACAAERFRKQVDFLNVNREVGIVASWARFQSLSSSRSYDYITKTKHEEILKEMHYKCSFIHPSVMFRKEVLDTVGLYPFEYLHAEDYAFFWKIIKKYKGAVLPEKLVQIAYSDKNISAENYKIQVHSRKKVIEEFGDSWPNKIIGVGMLTIKMMLPQKLINMLKS